MPSITTTFEPFRNPRKVTEPDPSMSAFKQAKAKAAHAALRAISERQRKKRKRLKAGTRGHRVWVRRRGRTW